MAVNTPTTSSTITEVITATDNVDGPEPILHLRLHKPKSKKVVQWDQTAVDNEHMNKKKSKCCCIYVKPLEFGESSSEDENECENCHGHVELKKKNKGAAASTPDDSCQTVTMEDDSRTNEDPLDPSANPSNTDDSAKENGSNPAP